MLLNGRSICLCHFVRRAQPVALHLFTVCAVFKVLLSITSDTDLQ